MMLFKVITIALITICAADNQKLLSEPKSEKELPSRRFGRYFIAPMNYLTKPDETTPNTILLPVRTAAKNLFGRLQYAPLLPQYKNSIQERNADMTTPSNAPEESELHQDKKSRLTYGKSHLEPHEEPQEKCYAPNLTSVSRSPGHNAVYRTITELFQKKPKPYDYVRPSGVNLNLEPLSTTFTPLIDLDVKLPHLIDMPLSLVKPDIHFVLNPVKTHAQTKTKRQFSPLTKYHRLHLNIARVYSPGQVQLPKPAPALALPSYPDLSQKTMVYPVKRHHVGYRLHFS